MPKENRLLSPQFSREENIHEKQDFENRIWCFDTLRGHDIGFRARPRPRTRAGQER
jgi:hypothetical protein